LGSYSRQWRCLLFVTNGNIYNAVAALKLNISIKKLYLYVRVVSSNPKEFPSA